MFPGVLAEGPFSLRQGERSCALSISAELSPEGDITAYSIAASHVTPTLRMTYDEVDAALASSDPAQLTPDLHALMQVSLYHYHHYPLSTQPHCSVPLNQHGMPAMPKRMCGPSTTAACLPRQR